MPGWRRREPVGRAESGPNRPRGIGALRASWKGREGAGVGRAQGVLSSRPGEQHGGVGPGPRGVGHVS
jgi:hypothetical protein